MTSEAKRLLSSTIRGLRERLLDDLAAEVERTYRFSLRARDAGLDEAASIRRRRFQEWTREQVRAEGRPKHERIEAEFRQEAVQQAAYTLLNRLVVLRLLEASGLRKPAVVTGGWQSRGYLDFREIAPALVRDLAKDDASEGFAFLFRLVCEELATDLPGLFGPAGIAELVPIPAATLRHAAEQLDQGELESCWTDDMTLGWVYQYWNDPEREVLDEKLNARQKLEPHEIASKTQMFTERYIVDWLLQNSLGPMWLALCRKHGWSADAEAPGQDGVSTLDRLEARRVEWRAKREAGEVSLTEMMPLHTAEERRWAYFVPQPIPGDAVEHAPESVRELRILDPAVGSGHFLVEALGLLVALYREEARHRGEESEERWSDAAIVERILEYNLHGIDLDPRAVQIAAAALWLKARRVCPEARPRQMNLVASSLRLASLPQDDPALVVLRREVEAETGIPAELTDTLVHALKGADHLGSLLRIDAAVEEALRQTEGYPQLGLYGKAAGKKVDNGDARRTLVGRLEIFLAHHGSGDDLGLRLRGEQLATGVRFVRMLEEGRYDLVVGNPPYQGTSKMAEDSYIKKHYPRGKADLYAAFLERGLQLARPGGVSGLLTMRTWLFLATYKPLRERLLQLDLVCLGDFGQGAFRELGGSFVAPAACVLRASDVQRKTTAALRPFEGTTGVQNYLQKLSATLCQSARFDFRLAPLKQVPGWPVLYWWSTEFVEAYAKAPKLKEFGEVRLGMSTSNNSRYTRRPWEALLVEAVRFDSDRLPRPDKWAPTVMGAKGIGWFEGLRDIVHWANAGLQMKVDQEVKYGSSSRRIQSQEYYFYPGIAFTMLGDRFQARIHRYKSIFGDKGSSVFPEDIPNTLCSMNRTQAARVVEDLASSLSFTVGDVAELPMERVQGSSKITEELDKAFGAHENHREPSVEFTHPGASPWRHVQDWAQAAVDRPEGAPLPPYEEVLDPEPPTDHLSFALGIALGRFGADREGILDPEKDSLDPEKDSLDHSLPAGICFLDGTIAPTDLRDSLGHAAASVLHDAWKEHGAAIAAKTDARTWLRLKFFNNVHRTMYENRPIHWPLSSAGKTFVAWVNIHRWNGQTLRVLLADHLGPALTRLEGELSDLREARSGDDRKATAQAENRFEKVQGWREELVAFMAAVEQCADQGPPPASPKCPEREQDAPYDPDLDDGVMINSAALWPLLDPQWDKPRKWWKELARTKGRKDYDWSHLALRYWPNRVDKKCRDDPSLGVAHGCFWRYHPERAWAWELRLQDEIGPDFRIEEPPYRPGGHDPAEEGRPDEGDGPHRDAWLRDHTDEALEAIEKEAQRRMGRGKNKKVVPEMTILETGIWSHRPEAVWEMELRLSERQEAWFRLRAPDEGEGRLKAAEERPDLVNRQLELENELEDRFPTLVRTSEEARKA